jgi:hypothetical protein
MIEHINTTVDAIIVEMLQLETYLHEPNGTMRAQLQTVFKMIQHCSAQQLTYLLRTCSPHVTLHAARRIDASQQLQTPFIASWIAYRYSPLNRFSFPVRLGGHGFINSEATHEAAYACSYSWYF